MIYDQVSAARSMYPVSDSTLFFIMDESVYIRIRGNGGAKLTQRGLDTIAKYRQIPSGSMMEDGKVINYFRLSNHNGSNPVISIDDMAVVFERLAIDTPIKIIAHDLGVHPSTLQRRIIRAEKEGFAAFRGVKKPESVRG